MMGVDAVLDGRVQAENDRLRVTLQLVSVRDGKQFVGRTIGRRAARVLCFAGHHLKPAATKIRIRRERKCGSPTDRKQRSLRGIFKGATLESAQCSGLLEALDYFQQSSLPIKISRSDIRASPIVYFARHNAKSSPPMKRFRKPKLRRAEL